MKVVLHTHIHFPCLQLVFFIKGLLTGTCEKDIENENSTNVLNESSQKLLENYGKLKL